jgi:hypothetical protein
MQIGYQIVAIQFGQWEIRRITVECKMSFVGDLLTQWIKLDAKSLSHDKSNSGISLLRRFCSCRFLEGSDRHASGCGSGGR